MRANDPPPDQERAEQATVMTEIKALIAALREDARQMWNTGLVREGSTPLAEQAASALEALISRSEVMEEDNVYAQEIIAEFKSEVAKLAENDPEFDALQKRRYPDDLYKGSWERGHLKASAKQYRNAAMLALHENIKQRDEIRSLRSALSLKAGKE